MKEEYSFTLTVPLAATAAADATLQQGKQQHPRLQISRKPDTKYCARFYLRFPFTGARPDLPFQEWLQDQLQEDWDLFGPTYGRWGFTE